MGLGEDTWRPSRPHILAAAFSPAGSIPSLSPPVDGAFAAQATPGGDLAVLLALGAFAGLCGVQLFGPSKHSGAANVLGAAMGAASIALAPAAAAHPAGSLGLAAASVAVAQLALRPRLAARMPAADAQAWAHLSSVALALCAVALQRIVLP